MAGVRPLKTSPLAGKVTIKESLLQKKRHFIGSFSCGHSTQRTPTHRPQRGATSCLDRQRQETMQLKHCSDRSSSPPTRKVCGFEFSWCQLHHGLRASGSSCAHSGAVGVTVTETGSLWSLMLPLVWGATHADHSRNGNFLSHPSVWMGIVLFDPGGTRLIWFPGGNTVLTWAEGDRSRYPIKHLLGEHREPAGAQNRLGKRTDGCKRHSQLHSTSRT